MTGKKAARQKQILAELTTTPTMRVSALSEALSVTTETIRRDLDELARQGLISRTYGGAMLRQQAEPTLTQRHNELVTEREAIARIAVPMLKDARVIMIGSGATTVHVARRLVYELNNITVITHSFGVATALAFNPTISVMMAPGLYHSGEGAMHGAQTVRFLSDFTADWAVLGASGLSPDGPSDALIEAADVYSAMLRQATRRMVVADHTKFDRMSTARYARWSNIDVLASDRTPTGPMAAALKRAEVETLIAPG
ncbi:DeoR/GlpR family DNA-binding transcription regulator [Rhodovulum adriaticum]|uniref:DeoR family transcriptional regulator n=1 Tax=Rhodovulum adriaticum TaxID=35804 RepID=A0A4R2NIC0_RHOAD|nr:DeoR/GlpR family DNA-binding transcription regulator [Rhodovulum adriaticum]MBK1635394.1 DeoR family transcriptional regulator [Rhodovulum adriaticum]TCP21100.1 DeoR family transcriptional regulator [Rhodovulum adriaticum]